MCSRTPGGGCKKWLLAWMAAESAGACRAPPAVNRALVSRACRTAIMFGDALTLGQSQTLVRCLSATRQWGICAHGRPTTAPCVSLALLRAARAGLRDVTETKMSADDMARRMRAALEREGPEP